MPETMSTIEQQLVSPEFYDDPYPAFARLQEEAPAHWSDAWGAWVLTRYADNQWALRSAQLFSSRGRVSYLLDQLPSEQRAGFDMLERHYQVGLTHSDPPDHTRLRNLLTKAFAPHELAAWAPRIQAVVDNLLDRAAAQGGMDIMQDLAYPLPAQIVAELLGAPASDVGLLRNWAIGVNRLFEAGGRTSAEAVAATQQSLVEQRAYILALASERSQRPQNDVISRLAAAERAGTINQDELVATAVTLFVAGHETTTYSIGNGLVALLKHPEQLADLRANPDQIGPAVEEMLRYDISVQRVWRRASEDIPLHDQVIKKGDLVLCMLGAANRDPRQFHNPHQYDIRRADNKHLTFGIGIHFCLGAPLARLEIPAAINSLLRRFPGLRLTDKPLLWRQDVALRGLRELPVIF